MPETEPLCVGRWTWQLALRRLITATIWIVSALLCTIASATVTAGFRMANAEYRDFETWLVSMALMAIGVVGFVASSLASNRRLTGRWFQISLGWLLACYVFVALGVVVWLHIQRWLEDAVAEGIVRSFLGR